MIERQPTTTPSSPQPVQPPDRSKPEKVAAAGSAKGGKGKRAKGASRRGKVIAASAAAGVLAATAAGVVAVKAFRGRSGKRGGKLRTYHVQPKGEDWQVKLDGADRAGSLHGTKKEAIAAGRELAQKNEPSRLVIHGGDGSPQRTHSYGEEG